MIESSTVTDQSFMARAVQLAARGLYSTKPNPRVGCVIVNNDRIVGEGWHEYAGENHAEINALNSAGKLARGATAYVTLEPCSHHGRTGPCCEALVSAGVSRVVVAMQDPNPLVSGRGVSYLLQNGVEVEVPILAEEAVRLNPGYIKRQQSGYPLVRCKLAMSLDGRTGLSNGNSKWITGDAAREDVQRLRARSCAIITGIDTVLADNPAMTVRREQLNVPNVELALKKQPLRVVLDSHLRIPVDARILINPEEVLVVCTQSGKHIEEKQDILAKQGVEVQHLPANEKGSVDLSELVRFLGARQCNELMFETGAKLAGSLVSNGLVDEIVVYVNARFIGDSGLPLVRLPEIGQIEDAVKMHFSEVRHLGDDLKITATFD